MDIDFSTLKLPIEPGHWRDADDRIFHASFVILGQFVEDELGTEAWEISGIESRMHRGYRIHSEGGYDEKAIDLWLWYRDELPKLQEAYTADLEECYGEMKFEMMENGLYEVTRGAKREPRYPYDYPETVKDEKLRELIELRRALWT